MTSFEHRCVNQRVPNKAVNPSGGSGGFGNRWFLTAAGLPWSLFHLVFFLPFQERFMVSEKIISSWENDWVRDRKLGGGAQGTTHLLLSTHDPSVLAVLKTLNNSKSDQARMRFQREILSLIELSRFTESVPKVIAHSDEAVEKPFFIMEYVSGKTLHDYVSSKGSLSLVESLELCRQLCETLRLAHRIPILHRDLKPDNIIIKSGVQATLTLVDFGLAYTSPSTVTEFQETFRNRFLLLPEMAAGGQDKRDHRSDLTSVVALLYYCLTGRIPEQLMDATGKKPHRAHPLNIDCVGQESLQHASWLAFFDRGFEYKVEDRFQSFDEMIFQLESIRANIPSLKMVSVEQAAADALAQLRSKNNRQFWIDEQKPKLELFWRKLHQYFDSHAKQAKGFRISSFSGGGALPAENFECQYAGGCTFSVESFKPITCIRNAVGFLDRQVSVFVGVHRSATNENLYADPHERIEWRIVAICSPDDLAHIDLSDLDGWISGVISESVGWIVDTINSSTSQMPKE